jgi:hypothetical protein
MVPRLVTHPSDRVVAGIKPTNFICRDRRVQEVPVLRDQEKHEAVDQAKHLTVVFLDAQLAVSKPFPEFAVARVGEKAASETGDGPLETFPQSVESPHSLLVGLVDPAFQPTKFGAFGVEAALVTNHPQHGEVSENLASEHVLKVEFDVGGAGEAGVIPQDPQGSGIRKNGPQVLVGTIEEVLDHRVGGGARRANDAFGAPIEVDIRS